MTQHGYSIDAKPTGLESVSEKDEVDGLAVRPLDWSFSSFTISWGAYEFDLGDKQTQSVTTIDVFSALARSAWLLVIRVHGCTGVGLALSLL